MSDPNADTPSGPTMDVNSGDPTLESSNPSPHQDSATESHMPERTSSQTDQMQSTENESTHMTDGCPSNSNPEEGPTILRVRGLPWAATSAEIVQFFSTICELTEDVIHIVRDADGRVSGQAFVEFPSPALCEQAQQDRQRQHLGERYLELYKATQSDLDCYLRRQQGMMSYPGGSGAGIAVNGKECVRLRGLPFSTTDIQVQRWFEEHSFPMDLANIAIGYLQDGRMTGEAWALVDNKQETITKLNKANMGRRYIEVFPSMIGDFETAKLGHLPGMGPHGGYSGGGYPGSGRPMSRDGYGGGYGGGGYGGGYGGRGYGGGYDRGYPPHGNYDRGPHRDPHMAAAAPGMDQFSCLRLRGLPYHADENNIVDFFNGFHMKAILPSTVPINNRPSGEAYVEFYEPDECMRAFRQKNGAMMERRYIELFPSSKQEMDWAADGMDPREIRKRLAR